MIFVVLYDIWVRDIINWNPRWPPPKYTVCHLVRTLWGKCMEKNPRIIERLYIQPKLQSREFSTRIELYFTINRVKSIAYLNTMYLCYWPGCM